MRKFLGMSDPVIPSSFPAELVKLAAERGVDQTVLLESAGMEADMLTSPGARASYRQLRVLARGALVETGDPALGLSLGSRFTMGRWGALGMATMSAANVGDALSLLVRYGALLAPHLEISQRIEGGRVQLLVDQHVRLGRLRPFMTETIVTSLLAQLRAIAGRPLTLQRVTFDYPAPEHADRTRAFFGCEVEFDADATSIELAQADLSIPLTYASAPSAAQAEAQCAQELDSVRERKSVVCQVRYLLRNRDDGFPDVRTAARALRTSERSLRRALSESGTSYQSLMDETRRELAMGYLRGTRVPVEDIARIAGFSDGRSFRRAFKRWTGMTPGEARAAS